MIIRTFTLRFEDKLRILAVNILEKSSYMEIVGRNYAPDSNNSGYFDILVNRKEKSKIIFV